LIFAGRAGSRQTFVGAATKFGLDFLFLAGFFLKTGFHFSEILLRQANPSHWRIRLSNDARLATGYLSPSVAIPSLTFHRRDWIYLK
jgi:hypothetical protein